MSSLPEPTAPRYSPTNPEELLARAKRRSAAIRRHRLVGAGGSLAVAVAVALGGIVLTGRAAKPGQIVVSDRIGAAYEVTAEQAPPAAPAAPVVKGVESSEVAFSLELLSRLAGSGDSNNQLVSPSSLATALAMLELGAAGSTEQGIAATLRSEGLSASQQAAGWHSLATLVAAGTSPVGTNAARRPELDVANEVWIQQGLAVRSAFVRALSSEFGTGVWRVDFENDLAGALSAINQWTSENTKGLIKELFSPGALDGQTRLVLADAVFFHADWAYQFATAVRPEPFHLGSGGTEAVPFMSSTPDSSGNPLTVPLSITHRYTAVELPYVGHQLSALVVMPTRSSLSSFVASLTPASLNRLLGGLSSRPIGLTMPTFTLRSDNHLNPTLSSMGMSAAFGPGADFSGIAASPPLSVQTVEQRAYLQVTPKGTTAAAATGVGVSTSAVEVLQRVVIDHPFLFLVRDNATGAILFESMIENPAS
jgi:serpin B